VPRTVPYGVGVTKWECKQYASGDQKASGSGCGSPYAEFGDKSFKKLQNSATVF